jgi:hypothetical protein
MTYDKKYDGPDGRTDLGDKSFEAGVQLVAKDARIAELEAEVARLKYAMRRAVSEGCVDHLDACDDAGAFWHNALGGNP